MQDEEKKTFNELFLTDKIYKIFESNERFKGINPDIIMEILKYLWIYTHGLTVLIDTNLIKNISYKEIINSISNISKIIIKVKSKGEKQC